MTTDTTPPRWATACLRRSLPRGVVAESIIGDVREEYERRAERARDVWYVATVMRMSAGYIAIRAGRFVARNLKTRRWLSVDGAGADVATALRSMRRRPGVAAVAIGTLGIGIGATTAIFSIVDTVLLRPLPYAEADRLVTVWNTYPTWRGHEVLGDLWDGIGLAYPEYLDLREGQEVFEDVAIYRFSFVPYIGREEPIRMEIGRASASLFSLLGVRPLLGRLFLPGEDGIGAPRLAVLSHGFWQREMGADSSAIGRSLTLSGQSYSVIGVLPPGFRVRHLGEGRVFAEHGVWIPIGAGGVDLDDRGWHTFEAVARLRPGVSLPQAEADAGPLLRGDRDTFQRGVRIAVRKTEEVGAARAPLLLLLGAVSLLMIIACANVASLMIGTAASRRRELALRASIGASPRRLMRQLLTENVALGIAGAALGLLVAYVATRFFLSLAPPDLRLPDVVSVDVRVLMFTGTLGVASGVFFGFWPARRGARTDPAAELRRSAPGARPSGWAAQQVLIVGELGLSVVLLISAGLLVKSLNALGAVDAGFNPSNLAVIRLAVPSSTHAADEQVTQFATSVIERVGAVPGVERVSATSAAPFTGDGGSSSFEIVGRGIAGCSPPAPDCRAVRAGEDHAEAERRVVFPGFHETLGIPFLAGRPLLPSDDAGGSPVVLVSEVMARRYWPGESAIGQRIIRDRRTWEIVGIVGDVRHDGLRTEARSTYYFPFLQEPRRNLTFVVRTSEHPGGIIPAIRRAVWSVDNRIPVDDVTFMHDLLARARASERYRGVLVTWFGVVAALLTGLSIFSVTARAVGYRTRELGIRMALGADGVRLVRLVVRQGFTALGLGVAIGVLGAVALTRVLREFLYGVETLDPAVFLLVTSSLVAVGLAAAYIPARRATGLRPSDVLRQE